MWYGIFWFVFSLFSFRCYFFLLYSPFFHRKIGDYTVDKELLCSSDPSLFPILKNNNINIFFLNKFLINNRSLMILLPCFLPRWFLLKFIQIDILSFFSFNYSIQMFLPVELVTMFISYEALDSKAKLTLLFSRCSQVSPNDMGAFFKEVIIITELCMRMQVTL